MAVGMVEAALLALWDMDVASAQEIRQRDDSLDSEEVAIEEACFRLMALQQPVARDFRQLAFILKANADIERVGDHATSIAKAVIRLSKLPRVPLPTALQELGQRIPIVCQRLLRTLMDQDATAARALILEDKTIDRLTRQLFDETVNVMREHPDAQAAGLLIHRYGPHIFHTNSKQVFDHLSRFTGWRRRGTGRRGGGPRLIVRLIPPDPCTRPAPRRRSPGPACRNPCRHGAPVRAPG